LHSSRTSGKTRRSTRDRPTFDILEHEHGSAHPHGNRRGEYHLRAFALVNEAFATRSRYVRKSPKAYLWRKLLGEQRAIAAVRYVFAPLTVFIGVGMLTFALLATLASLGV
jgi:hypothetical protein